MACEIGDFVSLTFGFIERQEDGVTPTHAHCSSVNSVCESWLTICILILLSSNLKLFTMLMKSLFWDCEFYFIHVCCFCVCWMPAPSFPWGRIAGSMLFVLITVSSLKCHYFWSVFRWWRIDTVMGTKAWTWSVHSGGRYSVWSRWSDVSEEGLGAVCLSCGFLHLLISVLIEIFVFIYSISNSCVATEKVSLDLGVGGKGVDNQALDS